ncbi:GNAT family N-acetyltransferase [Mesorhizobium sp.]|uniref:GNAT family N-acetyltransferase n=1 Tax=Mesorhizobium sp. TaxID=1871066 RepID=UPI0025EC01EC|nr:GNAT family N-acetyltransferase [Mesorhizobium sp.]
MLSVRQAQSNAQLDDVRTLMRAFVGWHRERHADDIALIDRYFDAAEFERELAGLPGKYAAPEGSLLVAHLDDEPAGCVAMRDLGEGVAEMKRMFVPVSMRKRGAGKALAEQIIADARLAGYRRMRLDTSIHQSEAMQLYEKCGFRRIEPYYALPDDMKNWLVFFELAL